MNVWVNLWKHSHVEISLEQLAKKILTVFSYIQSQVVAMHTEQFHALLFLSRLTAEKESASDRIDR